MLKELSTKNRNKVRKIIKATNGKFFFVIFTKRTNGELRRMVCRVGVSQFVKGEEGKGQMYDPEDKDLICVWEPSSHNPEDGDAGYRSINLRTVKEIHFAGQIQKFK